MKNGLPEIIIIGPAHPLRGGIASYNERLAKEFKDEGYHTAIYTFSLQYPSFLFPGKTQYSSEPAPEDLNISVKINSINPLNWVIVGNEIKRIRPRIVIVRYWLPFMGPCLGTIIRQIRKNKVSKIICLADNIIPHERRPGDKIFTNYFLKPVDGVVAMSGEVVNQLKVFSSGKPVKLIPHPLFDNFGEMTNQAEARKKLGIPTDKDILLFFGFIRKYKGLDLLLKAIKILSVNGSAGRIKLLIAGEFYENSDDYKSLFEDKDIADKIILRTHFIPDSEIRYYMCAADCVVQPYRHATQSGVTPLAYHFEIPMIVTRVGGLPDLVSDGRSGLIAEPTPESIAEKIAAYFEKGKAFFIPGLREEKKKYTWRRLTEGIFDLAESIS